MMQVQRQSWDGVPVWFYPTIDSTNSEALRQQADLPARAVIWAAEQTAGRGRLGRVWQARAGGSLCLSVFVRQQIALNSVSGLGPALGLAAARALAELGVQGIAVKWPNDLQVNGRKLGGILVEVASSANEQISIVAGIGINIDLGAELDIDQPWVDLAQLGVRCSAEVLAQRIAAAFLSTLEAVAGAGLSTCLADWPQFDALAGQQVRVQGGLRAGGRALGIADDGRLRLQDQSGEWFCHSGEVSVRAVVCS